MIVRRVPVKRYGSPYTFGSPVVFGDPGDLDVDVAIQPSTVLYGVEALVVAGVVTHLAIRLIDRWFDGRK